LLEEKTESAEQKKDPLAALRARKATGATAKATPEVAESNEPKRDPLASLKARKTTVSAVDSKEQTELKTDNSTEKQEGWFLSLLCV
jgi:hypothetical protein